MNEDLIVVVDFENICRLCLQSTGTLSEIFTACGEKTLQQQILCVTGLDTENGDGLPSKICHRCRHIVEQASELRDMVEKSQKMLERAIKREVLHNVEHGSDTEPFDNETFLQSLSDTNIEKEKFTTEKFAKIQDDTFENYVCNKSEIILPDAPFTEIPRAKFVQKTPAVLVCQICLSEFASKEEVRPHVELHYVGSNLQMYLDFNCGPYLCTFCDEIQLNKAQLVKHHRRHLGVNPFACQKPACQYVGKNMGALRRHMEVHGGEALQESCGRRSELVPHVQHVSRARLGEQACGTCGIRTGSEPALRLHMRAHHFVPEYVCAHGPCARSCASLAELRAHELSHGGRRRYRCHLCNVDDFTSDSGLRRHIMETHAVARSRMVTCAKCPATFEEHAVYYRHWLAHHGPWAPHRCRACNQGYPAESQLLVHERTCERLKNLLSIITEHTNGRTDSVRTDELSEDDPLDGEIQEDFYEMELGEETDYGD